MRPHSDLLAFRPSLDEHPDDNVRRQIFADFFDIECEEDPRGTVLRAACEIQCQVTHIAFPDRFAPFWTQSEGWSMVGKRLETLAQHPKDTDAFRARCQRLLRGDVPLDPEDLEPTLRLQYDLQVGRLSSLNLLEEDEDGEQCITALDGKRYPLPAFDEILARMQAPKMLQKLRQGFDTLLLIPFGLPLERFTDAWREGLRRNAAMLRSIGKFDECEPLWVWEQYRTNPLVYEPQRFTADHGGHTKAEMLATRGRGFDVLLVEGSSQNLPREGQGQTIGGRRQIECGRTPSEYLRDLPRGEVGLTPEAYILQFLDALERQGRVLDVDAYTNLTAAFLPSSRAVPGACWDPVQGGAYLGGVDPGSHAAYGVRAAARVV